MTDKQIIIDGEKENCKILFDCYHIDDSEAYRMIRNGVKITPENAPFDDFELRLISNENSVYGFTSLCKRNKNNDEWEYMGFGHSGAASVVTALLKELSRKEQECEELRTDIKDIANLLDLDTGEEYNFGNIGLEIKQLKAKDQECEEKDKYVKFLLEKLDLSNNRRQDCEIHWEKEKKNLKQQLDQLKAENEELKEQLERADEDIKAKCTRCAMTNQLDEQIEQLKAENEILKEKLTISSNSDKRTLEIILENKKLKQAIEKIKEVAEKEVKELTESAIHNGKYVQILQICDEVNDEQ